MSRRMLLANIICLAARRSSTAQHQIAGGASMAMLPEMLRGEVCVDIDFAGLQGSIVWGC